MAPVNYNFKMPSVKHFLRTKRMTDKRKEPVWVYLERQMRENIQIKPYNVKVGIWLKFLKELRFYRHCLLKRQIRAINRECGPPWYCEFTTLQKKILANLSHAIHNDLVDQRPTRTRSALWELGVTLKIPNSVLMHAQLSSGEDPGVFIWNLYSIIYKLSPSVLRETYDVNSKLLLSSLCFLDIKECIETFESLLFTPPKPKRKPKPKQPKQKLCRIPFYPYLQDMNIPGSCTSKTKKSKPRSVEYKFKLRSKESYERLMQSTNFLETRRLRNLKQMDTSRVCKYKFWEAPCSFRNTNKAEKDLLEKLSMLKKKADMVTITQTENNVVKVGGVAYSQTKPKFVIESICLIQTEYIHINGGCVAVAGECGTEFILLIQGYAAKTPDVPEPPCDCLGKWDTRVINQLEKYKCRCGHLYDTYNEGKVQEKMMYPPNRHGPLWFDESMIYKFNFREEFIKEQIKYAQRSETTITTVVSKNVIATDMSPKEIVSVLLADLSESPLLIPHLPKANILNNLLEWVRKRINGPLTVEERKKLIFHSQRRWVQLNHMDFRARAYRIQFTQTQLKHMTWKHKHKIQKLFHIILEDFTTRNRIMQLDQSRMWWSTMHYDQYPGRAFLDIFFTLMPSRMQETYFFNPYWTGNVI